MFKKFIAYLLTVSVLLSMVVVNVSAADEGVSAERVTKFENAVTLLRKIGAISTEDEFKFDSGISKGKFVDILSNIVPVSDGALVPVFQDVAADHEYFKVIQGFADAGYVNGHAGSFEPDREITYNEALYIVLNTMGYKDFMGVIGTYPTGGWRIAEELNIKMKNKGAVAGDILYMLYQALVTDMLEIKTLGKGAFSFSNEDGETLLEKYFEITDTKGVLQSNGQVSLVGGQPAREGVIVVDGTSYRTEEPCEILAGCKVDMFYDMETNDLVCILEAAENSILEIDSASLYDYIDGKYTYKVDGSKKSAKINDITNIVKNNVLVTEVPDDMFMVPVNGKVILINNNNDSGYDVAYIKEYVSFLVKAVEKDIDQLTIKADARYDLNNVVANIENEAPSVYDNEGNRISVEDITIGNVVSVMGNLAGEDLIAEEIVVSDSIVTGTLTTIYGGSEPTLVIDDVKYLIAASVADVFLGTISPQMDMTFLTDFMGYIVALDDSISGSMAYGYLLEAEVDIDEDGDERIFAKIFSEIGAIIEYKVSNKILTINGETLGRKDKKTVRIDDFTKHVGEIVRYDVNNDRELSKIDTAKKINDTTGPYATVDDRLYQSVDNMNGTVTEMTQFYGSKKAFGSKVHVDEDTLIFKLPDDVKDDEDEAEYKIIRSYAGLKDGRYGIKAYKLGKDMMHAKVIVLRELLRPDLSTDHIGNMMVKKVTQVVNEYNEPTYSITLVGADGEKTYQTKNERIAKFPVDLTNKEPAVARTVVPGDIVRCYLTEDETAIAKIAICYDIRNSNVTDTSSKTTDWVSDNGTFSLGYAYAMDDKRIGIARGAIPTDTDTTFVDNEYDTYLVDSFKIFKVETASTGEAREITRVDKSEIKTFKQNGTNCSRVIAISSRGTGQLLFIVE